MVTEREPRAARLFRRARPDAVPVLATARRVAGQLADGLTGTGARAAARGVRNLLGARAVGLADLSGAITWSGPPAADAGGLVSDVLHSETPSGKAPLQAVPLDVDGELAGVLVVEGAASRGTVREVARLVESALARGKLESSAELAAQSELRALRAEISPHFVYNALTVIASLVRTDPDRSRELMLDFADHIRHSLAKHGDYTALADEFHAIETYLALQRAVLGDRLRVQIRVAPDVLAVPVPYLVLQPLVENAIRHGIEPLSRPGTVSVRGGAEGNDCVISVEDDGAGMPPEDAEAVLSGDGERVGLANVDRRLRSVYGPWYGLVVETAPGAGTRVLVRVPLFQPGVILP
ncbi:histidine kinase [Amycolatopsis endophytica]|uniref:sensor histidine kinase n=1 Tax=Amycolatopsis endophytica TaxID=860233 RepID=UPI0035E441C7